MRAASGQCRAVRRRQINFGFSEFDLTAGRNRNIPIRVPPPLKGAFRDRHGRWVRDAVDALALQDEQGLRRTAKSCGPDIPTLISSFAEVSARRRWQQSPAHRGDHEGSRKTIARGMPGDSGVTVVTMLVCFFIFAHKAAGACDAPGIPCALSFFRGQAQQLGRRSRREKVRRVWSRRHCEPRNPASFHTSFRGTREREPGIHGTARMLGGMDSGPAPYGASRNDEERIGSLRRVRSSR
jgi:hypothetical protein